MKGRVYAVTGIPPEINAYATVRYSRSADTMQESIRWIYRQSAEAAVGQAEKFLDTYYFQYGHGSIADCGHVTLAIEQWSQLMAEEVEDEPLWDGQEQSTRYQDFSRPKFWKPRGWADGALQERYLRTIHELFATYHDLSRQMFGFLCEQNPKPESMRQADYDRTIRARSFDVARYLLPMATLTNVGQTTSIRVLERQICRLLASRHPEIRLLGDAMARACQAPAYHVARERFREWMASRSGEALSAVLQEVLTADAAAPTLARHLQPDTYLERTREQLSQLATTLLPKMEVETARRVDLVESDDYFLETVITALYWVTPYSYRQLQQVVRDVLTPAQRSAVWQTLFAERRKHDELLRIFRGGYPLLFDTCIDIGADRDLKRHRRCVQVRQDLSTRCGFETPTVLAAAGLEDLCSAYQRVVLRAHEAAWHLAAEYPLDALYVLPLGTRRRRLYKMDPAEAVYIAELRTGVGGHFSYRAAAWQMYELLTQRYAAFDEHVRPRVTNPSIEAPLQR